MVSFGIAKYGADEKVRQAYTYGESGIGERGSVDKSEESSYYLYDGRNRNVMKERKIETQRI